MSTDPRYKIRPSRQVLLFKPANGASLLIAWDPGEEKTVSGYFAKHQHLEISPCLGLETLA
jgi:hypothetical protein